MNKIRVRVMNTLNTSNSEEKEMYRRLKCYEMIQCIIITVTFITKKYFILSLLVNEANLSLVY